MYFTIWIEKIDGQGEDAPPTLLFQSAQKEGLLAVYDGLGGAGSKTYLLQENKQEIRKSGAYLASRLAKESLEQAYHREIDKNAFLESLENTLKTAFQTYAQNLDSTESKLKSKLIKTLPTTLAGLYYTHKPTDKTCSIQSFWAGDSRNYLLTSAKGLQPLSTDDLHKNPDALENLWQDAPLSNCIEATGNYHIHQKTFSITSPAILISASDGCFGYLPSPMHFEYILLKTLIESVYDAEDWRDKLIEMLLPIAADDVSLSLVALGIENLNALKVYLFTRYQSVYQRYILPWEALNTQKFNDIAEKKEAQQTLWKQYSQDYYALLQEDSQKTF